MKTSIRFILLSIMTFIVFVNFACKEEKQVEPVAEIKVMEDANGTPEITHSDFKAIWETIKLLWESRDKELISSVYADEFVRISPSGTSKNATELAKEFELITVAYPDMKLVLDDYTIHGNEVVIYWSANGTFSGELMGVQGNGKPFENIKGITVLTFQGNKVAKDDSYWNALEMFMQTGYKIVEESKN